MHDVTDLIRLIKKVALDAVKASYPADVAFGYVVSASPLQINVEQKLTLTSAQLVLTSNVTDYKIKMSSGDEEKTYTVHNSLKTGDKVVMLQMKGGQKYVVIDRMVDT